MERGKHTQSKIVHSLSAFFHWPHGWDLKLSIVWPENPSALFHTGLHRSVSPALLSFTSFSQPVSAHRRAVMWFQCLGPCGMVPSGGKPLRLCWHITPPIINSRSALSFLLRLSSFLLTAPSFCFARALISAAGSFTSSHLQHFSSNLPSQQSFPPPALRCTALNDSQSPQRITYFTRPR